MKRHVTCFVEKSGFEPRTFGIKAERYDHCATRPVVSGLTYDTVPVPERAVEESLFNVDHNKVCCLYGKYSE